MCIFNVLWTIVVFLLARDALRDLKYFFLTNNLRLAKKFLEISNESLTAKIRNIMKSWKFVGFHMFVSIICTYMNVFWLLVFWSKHKLLCGIAENFFRQMIWGLLTNFLRSSMKLSCKNVQIKKSCILSQISYVYFSYVHILEHLLTFGILFQAKGSLRDLRYFFSTNNLRLAKKFFEISNEFLTLK